MNAVIMKQAECARALLPVSDLAITSNDGTTAFHAAVGTASEACFELLLPMISDVNVRTLPGVNARTGEALAEFNLTPLHAASQIGHLSMCKALLSRGADWMARDNGQWIPLHHAARQGHLSCVLQLVGQPGRVRMTPVEVDAAGATGATALHCAAQHGSDQICGVLVGAGARLDAQTSDGRTPLMFAQHWHPTNATLLALLSGAVPAQQLSLVCDHCGKTAEEASVKVLKDCGKCFVVRYCGKVCQLAAWPEHKAACKARAKEREERVRPELLKAPAFAHQRSTS